MIQLMILIMQWVVTLVIAVICGYVLTTRCFNRKKPIKAPKEPTSAEKKEMERTQREYENFMTYTGKPQDRIDTE